jgi:hypothetical protein
MCNQFGTRVLFEVLLYLFGVEFYDNAEKALDAIKQWPFQHYRRILHQINITKPQIKLLSQIDYT